MQFVNLNEHNVKTVLIRLDDKISEFLLAVSQKQYDKQIQSFQNSWA